MAATRITPIEAIGPYVVETESDQFLEVTPVAADAANGNIVSLGRDVILRAENTGASSRTITVTSYPDRYGRIAPITSFAIPAGDIFVRKFTRSGWGNGFGDLEFTASHAEVTLEIYAL